MVSSYKEGGNIKAKKCPWLVLKNVARAKVVINCLMLTFKGGLLCVDN